MKSTIREIDGKWYAFAIRENNVYSIGNDCPRSGGLWTANFSDSGIKYVSSPSPNKHAAYQKAWRFNNEIKKHR